MPYHCIAPGCTSGYKSNPEKVHFFAVPKDENIIKLWQIAIRRKDFVVRSGQFLCQNHFLPEDILWKREVTGFNGQVLGVSYYKQPRLRKGVVPSQFPWMEISTPLGDIPLQDTQLQETTQNPTHEVSQHCNTEEIAQEAMSDEPPKFSFTDLVACTTLRVPINWTRRTLMFGIFTIESFVTVTCIKIENSFVTVNTKELIVQENLNFNINIMCKPFAAISLGICSDAISSIDKLEAVLCTLDSKKLCCGAPTAKSLVTYGSTVIYVDSIGTVRHKQCLLLLDNEVQCTFCKRLEGTLKRKELRQVEHAFQNHYTSSNVLELVITDILENKITFPCTDHAEEVISFIISFYVETRMRQYAKQINRNQTKKSGWKKKQSKFYCT